MKKILKVLADSILPQYIKNEYIARGKKMAFSGDDFYCPCCEQNYKVFLPFGLNVRFNALCPGCFSLERHRLLWTYLREKTNLFSQGGRLFHVAPEELFFKKFKSLSQITYYPCAKFGEGYPDKYSKGTHNVDITAINQESNSFDCILCNHVLEHIPDDVKAMSELYRILRPGGWAILQVPIDNRRSTTFEDFSITDPRERERLFGQNDHVRIYGKDYRQRLERVGFEVKVDDYANRMTQAQAVRLGVMQSEDIYFCSKPV